MRSPFFGEFMGTLVLVLLGNGVVAGVLLKRSKAENSGWMVIATGWGFAVLCGVYVAVLCGSADAHLNPAITLAMAVQSRSFGKFLPYVSAQMLGAFTGATLVWLHYLPHWKITEDPEAKRAAFCTAPAIRNLIANFLSEVIGTAVLVLVVGAMTSKLVLSTGPAAGLSPYLVGCLVWSIGLSLGGTTGYAINPARDFGPRVAHAVLPIAGKGHSDWSYAPIPILGPCAGGILAGWLLRALGS
ncbi:MAG TPA: MIP/aquaporin family protein [Pseudacidobacterium sp.]|jgi:glycerol uptake facilitator protein|nr:MIP/aquaporin family protein [Pseudacidobacterium sp.]